MKQQSVVNHTIHQNDIPVLLTRIQCGYDTVWLRTLHLSKCCVHKRKKTRLSVGLLRIGQVFSVSVELCIAGLRQTAI